MAKLKFTLDQIKIGDEVHYNDYYINMASTGYFRWVVIAKLQGTLIIEQSIDGQSQKRAIELKDVLNVVPANKL